MDKYFKKICDHLKKYRITCTELDVIVDMAKDRYRKLFKILKPAKVQMYSKGSDQIEALLVLNGHVGFVSHLFIYNFRKKYLFKYSRMRFSPPSTVSPNFGKY